MGATYTTEQLRELYEQLKSVTVYPDVLTAFHWSTLAANIEDHDFYPDRFFHWVCNTGKQMFPRYYQWLVGISVTDLPKHLSVKNPAVRVIIQWRLRYG
jgi:hypothetical protein